MDRNEAFQKAADALVKAEGLAMGTDDWLHVAEHWRSLASQLPDDTPPAPPNVLNIPPSRSQSAGGRRTAS